MLVDFFPRKIYFSAVFDFHCHENPCFHDEFQDLIMYHRENFTPRQPVSLPQGYLDMMITNGKFI